MSFYLFSRNFLIENYFFLQFYPWQDYLNLQSTSVLKRHWFPDRNTSSHRKKSSVKKNLLIFPTVVTLSEMLHCVTKIKIKPIHIHITKLIILKILIAIFWGKLTINSCRIIGRFLHFGPPVKNNLRNFHLGEKFPQKSFVFLYTVRISSPNILLTTYKEIRRTRALHVSTKKN